MSLFKKPANTNAQTPSISYPVEVAYWKDFYESISHLLADAGVDLNTLRGSGHFNCKLILDIENEQDPNAVKVYAAPTGRSKTYYEIGYVPSDYTLLIRPDIKKVVSGSHYWSIRWYFDVKKGLELSIYLNESKFK